MTLMRLLQAEQNYLSGRGLGTFFCVEPSMPIAGTRREDFGVDTSHSSHDRTPDAGWQTLGELKLPVDARMEDTLNAWLLDRLAPLDLHADLLKQVLKSAQNAAVRARESQREVEFAHLHFLLFVPEDFVSKGQTWGFFHIEKKGSPTGGGEPHGSQHEHWIAYYLFLEG